MDKERKLYLKEGVVSALEGGPMHFAQICDCMNIEKGSEEWSELSAIISILQTPSNTLCLPVIKNTFPIYGPDKKPLYPMYLVKNETKLVLEGILSKEERKTPNLHQILGKDRLAILFGRFDE